MDPARFYGSSKLVNPVPGDGSLSDDVLASDSDSEFPVQRSRLPRRPVVIPETDSESSYDEEDDYPLSSLVQKKKRNKSKATKILWQKGNFPAYDKEKYSFRGVTELPSFIQELESPADYFLFLFTDDLFEMIVEQSNLKALQDNINKPANVTNTEMQQFVGTILFMSLVKLPAARCYWNKTVGQAQVYETMTCNRWETIKRFLHFNDNSQFIPFGNPGYDKLFKVKPLLQAIRQQLLLVPKEEFLAVDEQIIPTKCRHELKQYNPAKPHKWGYKNQVLSGASGFSYDFDLFAGEQSNTYPEGAPDLGVSSNVVTRLTESVTRHVNHKIFFDNWFNSPRLQVYLSSQGLLPLGTVRLNRVPNSEMPTEKELKNLGRGHIVEKVAVIDGVKISVISWYDNKPVNMLSTYVGTLPKVSKRRYFRKEKQYRQIPCPQAVEVYNKHMGGVDLLDSMLGLYRIHLRSKKWYKRVFFHMLDLCVVNAWILWRRKNETETYMPLFDFKLALVDHLCKAGKIIQKKRGRPSKLFESRPGTPSSLVSTSSRQGSPTIHSNPATPTRANKRKRPARHQELPLASVRTDSISHFPDWQKSRQICQLCSKKSYTKCKKCDVFLCYNDKRNCFCLFHE